MRTSYFTKDYTKFFQVVLTLFYGQFLSNSIFDNFILTIPELSSSRPSALNTAPELSLSTVAPPINHAYYYVTKIVLGVFICITSVFSLIVVWKKNYRLIFLSGIILLFIFITTVVLTTVHLTLDFDKRTKAEMGKLIAELSVESLFQLIAVIATFFMASRRDFGNEEDTQMNQIEERSLSKRQIMSSSRDEGSPSKRQYSFVPREDNTRYVKSSVIQDEIDEENDVVQDRATRQYPKNDLDLDF